MLKKCLLGLVVLLSPLASHADDAKEYSLTIKDHRFSPEVLEIPAGEKIKLVISNEDTTPEEFESHDLKREKVIKGNSKGIVLIGPVEPGTYNYFGEFNQATAKGSIVAK